MGFGQVTQLKPVEGVQKYSFTALKLFTLADSCVVCPDEMETSELTDTVGVPVELIFTDDVSVQPFVSVTVTE